MAGGRVAERWACELVIRCFRRPGEKPKRCEGKGVELITYGARLSPWVRNGLAGSSSFAEAWQRTGGVRCKYQATQMLARSWVDRG